MNNFFDFTGKYIDDYKPKNKLVQCYEYTLNPTDEKGIEGEKWVILCYNLNLSGNFINWSGEITIFCKNIICNGLCTLDVSGKSSTYPASKKDQPDGDQRDGINADNIDKNGTYFGNDLNGKNGGRIIIYSENVSGNLILKANGGNGAKGQNGGDANKGKDGHKGNKVFIPSEMILEEDKINAAGSDGGEPTNGGRGATGGNGGFPGELEIYSLNWNFNTKTINECFIQNGGNGGDGGSGGGRNCGGDGGEGGEIWYYRDGEYGNGSPWYDEKLVGTGNKGYSWLDAYGYDGNDGNKGKSISNNAPTINPSKNLSIANNLTPNYFRSLLLQAEDFYINNNLNNAISILEWIVEIERNFKKNNHQSQSKVSEYYDLFPVEDFEPFISKAKIYINQISQGADFFGNFSNYTTLLDESFLDKTILNYKNSIVSYETLLDQTMQQDNSVVAQLSNKNQIKESINANINLIKHENTKLSDSLEPLNKEIIGRLEETDKIKFRIEELEEEFRRVVQDATNGCSLKDTLSTITKIVSVGVAISSGIGAIGAAAAVVSGSASLIEDFKTKYNKTNPGFDTDKWKEIVEEGQNKDGSKDTSIINQVEKIQKSAGDFAKDAKAIGEAYNQLQEKKSSLVTIPQADLNNASNKQKFIEQMKDFISKYDEAKAYQDEVIYFFDFCDLTNQKRLQFTNTILQIMKNTNDILIYEKDISEINSNLLMLNDNKLSSYAKTIIIDTYLKLRKFYVKLIYLQKKSIDFLLLKNTQFSLDFYNGKIDAIDSNYLANKALLIDALENSTASSIRTNIDIPYEISKNTHPVTFKALKESKFSDDNTPISFFFSLPVNCKGLDHIREIKLFSVKIYLIGVKTKTGSIGFSLRHFGNSVFLTKNNETVGFNHNSIIKPLQYLIDSNKYDLFFDKSKSKYYSAEIKNDYYVGISPFANWGIYIPKRSINEGLDLSNIEKIQIVFEYECQSENF